MKVTLYTIGCTACDALEERLNDKKIQFQRIDDFDTVAKKAETNNIANAPILEVDGEIYDYKKAVKWVKEQ